MTQIHTYLLLLIVVTRTTCELNLQIIKNYDDFLSPVSDTVEERLGSSFSLICELVSSINNTVNFDENLAWFRGTKPKDRSAEFYHNMLPSQKELNKSERKFKSLQFHDHGLYYCVSFKFNLVKQVEMVVRSDVPNDLRPMSETSCNEQMFECASNGVCIGQHYVCDGKKDCKDGSDESAEKCNGEPCRDKIPCADGRCIPTAWCCDRHHDLNCTVTNRPTCCQVLSESYEELEYGFPNTNQPPNQSRRYIWISVCIVSIAFCVMLLLLILSKVVTFAKKRAFQQQQAFTLMLCDANPEAHRTNPSNAYFRTPLDGSDVNDPLIFPPRFNLINDQPPSYIEVLKNSRVANEPPPPYTSREVLNVGEDGATGRH